jgi:hypothetical protein
VPTAEGLWEAGPGDWKYRELFHAVPCHWGSVSSESRMTVKRAEIRLCTESDASSSVAFSNKAESDAFSGVDWPETTNSPVRRLAGTDNHQRYVIRVLLTEGATDLV